MSKRITEEKESSEYVEFIVPDYIKAAIDWMCEE